MACPSPQPISDRPGALARDAAPDPSLYKARRLRLQRPPARASHGAAGEYTVFSLSSVLSPADPSLQNQTDPNIGSARGDSQSPASSTLSDLGVPVSTSAAALLTTFVPAFAIAVCWFGLFLVGRRSQQRFYAPKATLRNLHDHERAPELPSGFFNWIGVFGRLPDSHVLRHASLDGYFFVRFLKTMARICLIGCAITWPILFPIHLAGGAGNRQLDALSFSNVRNPTWYYAHAVAACLFFSFVFCTITRESILYATLRQAYLLSPLHANRISSRTVLFLAVPQSYLCKKRLSKIFGDSVRRIWITTDCADLQKLVKKRDRLAYRLEEVETTYIKKVNAACLKSATLGPAQPGSSAGSSPIECEAKFAPFPLALPVQRPYHRLGFFFGKSVDTIEWLRAQLQEVIPQVEALQKRHRDGDAKAVSAVFIEFNSQMDAQIAFQTLSHHHPFRMTPRFIGISPSQVIWPTLQYSWWQRIVRKFLIQGFIAVLIIFWSVPSAFVGSISNITYLTNLLPFLKFVNRLPSIVKGAISGVLPTIALAALMSLVPIILRWCGRQSGLPSAASVELFTQNAHFVFQVVQVFLVTTLTSAASAATSQIIKNPLSAKDLLAENLPKASNFYISYFLFQGLILSSSAVIQVLTFLVFKLLRILFDRTPRKLYQRWASLTGLSWGTVFPVFTNMAVIAITYSCIAPLILGFSSLGLYLVYQAYRYNLLFVYDATVDTKGLIYPRALKQVLTGIYLAEICLIGLFAIRGAIGPLAIMAVFTLLTVLSHISLNDALRPLLSALPRTLDNEDAVKEEILGDLQDQTLTVDPEKGRSSTASIPPVSVGFKARVHRRLMRLVTRLLHPSSYADYALLRKKVRQDPGIVYDQMIDDNAYYPPPVVSPTPLLWIPRDRAGYSRQEIALASGVIRMTDEEAHLDEKNKVVWDKVGMKPPIWKEKVFY
ncbi:hypothetical protein LOZ52_006714 [Ophidiomyces ophidiicola]|nr:hypothetical protein LOZ64_006065 [Ophidiomyces ophidiicola]KAI1973454.1 hypothetical protein LOZ54_006754 [Ophidiomyces ophidiicola]KAI1975171.1 hypothetical protein LOZ55_004797 [Ophidiomyces ophidiicola]KAI1998491.1 hypothetical protein LOZ51_002222 [Ophidiomyces ophidiicola]KAI2001301.1 hypothetical protein LOZ50_005795 [Ophidiomyces ophidiicola]